MAERELTSFQAKFASLTEQKLSMDQIYDISESVKSYFSAKQTELKTALTDIEGRRKRLPIDSLILSATQQYLGGVPFEQRRRIRQSIQKRLMPDSESDVAGTFALCFDGVVEDARKVTLRAAEHYVSPEFLGELLFMLSCGAEKAVILRDDWGIASEVARGILTRERDIESVFCSKLGAQGFVKYKIQAEGTVAIYDGLGKGLAYDSGLVVGSIGENVAGSAARYTIIPSLSERLKCIIVQSGLSSGETLRSAMKSGVKLLNAEVGPAETNDMGVAINKIFYKNLLPELYERWREVLAQWKARAQEEQEAERRLETQLLEIHKVEDFSFLALSRIADDLKDKPDTLAAYKEYKTIAMQHPLLASYSNALSIVLLGA